jgi:hypothetical protein
MKIVDIFAVEEDSLYAVLYEGEELDEFNRMMDMWSDPEYLEEFFEENRADLENGFFGNITIEKAIAQVRMESKRLKNLLIEIAQQGKSDRTNTLTTLFKPLWKNPTSIEPFEKNKVKAIRKKCMIRMYAIRIDTNLFIISGGAIKLTKTMNDRPHLQGELKKLEVTQSYCMQRFGIDPEWVVFEEM